MSRTADRCRPILPGLVVAVWLLAPAALPARGELQLPALFGDHMVLQRDLKDRVWGRADPGEEVTVRIADQSQTARADDHGDWSVNLDPMKAGGPHELTVEGKNDSVTFHDVLIGEVWLCSGQSNMQMGVDQSQDGDLEVLAADFPQVRLITVPQVAADEPRFDFKGKWELCTPETIPPFSAVGYFFGRQLYQTLQVPIGLIDDSWGGSAAESWVPRDRLAGNPKFQALLDRWDQLEKDLPEARARYEKDLADWQKAAEQARAEGRQPSPQPQNPEGELHGNHRPANIYNGVLKPTIGYGIRGVVWYQGESNAGHAYQYRELFPLLIQTWRDEWGIGNFPFYWVQLADFQAENPEPGESDWAELREAQSMTQDRLPNTGQAVIIDLGEGRDIHPKNKQEVAHRLARWPLAREYGFNIPYQSPTFRSMEQRDGKLLLTFDHVGQGLRAFDVDNPRGFAIAGQDRKFVWAQARIIEPDQVEVWSDQVPEPVAVRYAWASNPVVNLYSKDGLPVDPFRSDDWPGVTADRD